MFLGNATVECIKDLAHFALLSPGGLPGPGHLR
jgi:hypothetical protein